MQKSFIPTSQNFTFLGGVFFKKKIMYLRPTHVFTYQLSIIFIYLQSVFHLFPVLFPFECTFQYRPALTTVPVAKTCSCRRAERRCCSALLLALLHRPSPGREKTVLFSEPVLREVSTCSQ